MKQERRGSSLSKHISKRKERETMKKFLLTQKITLFLVIMSLIVSLSMGDSLIPNSPQAIDQTPDSIDDLDIDFTLNQTSIGRHNGALAEINLLNLSIIERS